MKMPVATPEQRLRDLGTPTNGVLGLVDELLAIAVEHGLVLQWHQGGSRARVVQGGSADWLDVPLRKSVLRAALARLAVLCNERQEHPVTPYGGQGEITFSGDPNVVLHIAFVNTPDEQSVEMVTKS